MWNELLMTNCSVLEKNVRTEEKVWLLSFTEIYFKLVMTDT